MIELQNCSQPFLFEQDGSINLLACFADTVIEDHFYNHKYSIRPWKIHIKRDLTNDLIRVKLPNHVINYGKILLECNPYVNNDIITLTCGFKQNPASEVKYYLCCGNLVNEQIDNFQVVSKTFGGLICDENIFQINDDGKSIDMIDRNTKKIIKQASIPNSDGYQIMRISKIFNNPNFIVTLISEKDVLSMVLDENFNYVTTIKDDNQNVYKCSLYKNYLAYTVRHNSGPLENRSLIIKELNHLIY